MGAVLVMEGWVGEGVSLLAAKISIQGYRRGAGFRMEKIKDSQVVSRRRSERTGWAVFMCSPSAIAGERSRLRFGASPRMVMATGDAAIGRE